MSVRKNINKGYLVSLIVILLLLLFVLPVVAQSSGELSFGIRPTKALEDQEETFSYFSYRVSPATIINDEALVLNAGNEPVTLKIYAADGVTSQNGGTGFAAFGQQSSGKSRGVSEWISLPLSEIKLAPGEEKNISFQVSIPADASPGHHIAGLVVEAPPASENLDSSTSDSATGNEAQFTVNVIRRVGVAVVLNIPGDQISGLEVNNISLYQQSEEGATFAIDIKNTGNIFTTAAGFFIVTDKAGENLITTIPLQIDTILPGDSTVFYVPRPIRFNDGEYLLSVILEYDGKRTVLEGVGMTIKDSQPQLEGKVSENIFSQEEIEVFFDSIEKEGGSVWLTIAVISILLAFVVGGYIYWAGGKNDEKEKENQPGAYLE